MSTSSANTSPNHWITTVLSYAIFIGGSIFLTKVARKRVSDRKIETVPDGLNESTLKPYEHERKMKDRISSQPTVEESIERTKVVVRVPATSANLGPGFDAIGMALDMWSEYTIERSDKFEIECEGEGASDMPMDESNLVCFALRAAFKTAGKQVPPLKYKLVNRIPYARGLGSSSAAIVGGLIAGLVLAGL